MKRTVLMSGSLSVLLLVQAAVGGCIEELGLAIPPKFNVDCKVAVQQNPDGSFNYFYTVANDLSSNQSVDFYYVEVKDTSLYPLTRGSGKPNWIENKVGVLNPVEWNGARDPHDRYISWAPDGGGGDPSVDPLKQDIFPGQRLTGFGNEARPGPPAIGVWWVLPWKPMLQSNIDGGGEPNFESCCDSAGGGVGRLPRRAFDELGEGEYALRGKKLSKECSEEINAATSAWLQDQSHDSKLIPRLVGMQDAVGGFTLVASDPLPDGPEGVCGALERLIGEVRQAAELGWIKEDLGKNPPKKMRDEDDGKKVKSRDNNDDEDPDDDTLGFAESVVKKLEKARRDCGRGRLSNVRRILSALLRQVNAQRAKHLTDEAYYLLRLNIIYLQEKL